MLSCYCKGGGDMQIQPNSIIKLCKGVPFDNSYNDSMYFESKEQQYNYFNSKVKHTMNKASYTRVNGGNVRFNLVADSLYDCNYLMFQNTSYGNKWFYAFITEVEYLNDGVTNVHFEIDVLQTWYFDYEYRMCYIERAHSLTDEIGDNIVAESFDVGDYFNTTIGNTGLFTDYACVIASPYKFNSTTGWISDPYTQDVNNLPNATHFTAFYGNTAIQDFLTNVLGSSEKIESVSACYAVPKSFIPFKDNPQSVFDQIEELPTYCPKRTIIGKVSRPTKLGTYTPKNNKMLTYPYSMLRVETYGSDAKQYAFEFFNDPNNIVFDVYANLCINTSFRLVPLAYKNDAQNYKESCVMADFPMVAFTIDSFKAWVAQNKSKLAIQGFAAVGGIASGVGSIMKGSQIIGEADTAMQTALNKGAMKSDATAIRDKMIQQGRQQQAIGKATVIPSSYSLSKQIASTIDTSHMPDRVNGSADGGIETAMRIKDFNFIHMYINPTDAQIIDDYFTMFGYAIKQKGVPTRHARRYWTYVQTKGCKVVGNCPSDDIKLIEAIHDKGVTFWTSDSVVGNYNLDNSCLS